MTRRGIEPCSRAGSERQVDWRGLTKHMSLDDRGEVIVDDAQQIGYDGRSFRPQLLAQPADNARRH